MYRISRLSDTKAHLPAALSMKKELEKDMVVFNVLAPLPMYKEIPPPGPTPVGNKAVELAA